jgi:hypothetical protein
MKRLARLLIIPGLLGSCRAAPVSTRSVNDLSPVIFAFIKERAGFKHPLILDRTADIPGDWDRYVRGSWLDSGVVAVKEAVRDMLTAGRTHVKWDPSLIAAVGARSISSTPNYESFTGPGGQTIIEISGPGFSSDSTVAAVYWSYYCGSLCAGADVALFRKDAAGVWKGWRSQMLWIS